MIHRENKDQERDKERALLLAGGGGLESNIITMGFLFFMYLIELCFICRPSDSTVAENAGIESMTVATLALVVRRSNHSAKFLDFCIKRLRTLSSYKKFKIKIKNRKPIAVDVLF